MKYNMHIQILKLTNMLQLDSYMQAVIMIIIIPPYANKLCKFFDQKQRYWILKFVLSSLWGSSSGPVNPWADSTVVPSAKVNCCPWVTVHIAILDSVFKTIIS